MNEQQIKAIVFDVDGVLCQPLYRFASYLEREYQITREQTKGFFTGPFLQCIVGRADLKVEVAPFLDEWGWPGTVDSFLHHWFAEEASVDQQLIEVIARLRASSYACFVASNQEQYRTAYLRKEMGFATLVNHTFTSAEVGVAKPAQQFFDHVTQAILLLPSEILFWDDTLANVQAAAAYGWHAEQYLDFARFQRRMAELGLL